MARQFPQGYLGLQTHGGTDRISYREIQVKEIAAADIPVNTVAPSVTGSGYQGKPLTCNHGTWTRRRRHDVLRQLVPLEQDPADAPALPRPERDRLLGNFTTPADPTLRHARR